MSVLIILQEYSRGRYLANLGRLAAFVPPSGSEYEESEDDIHSIAYSAEESEPKSLNSNV